MFLKNSVEFCGYKIDKYGLYKIGEKVNVVVQVKVLENVIELCVFLGFINYYGKFMLNLFIVLR